MKVSVVHPSDLGPAEIATWRSIQMSVPELASPFLSPEFTVAVGDLRQRARVAVISEGPDIVGFFPYERRKWGLGTPICSGHNDSHGVVASADVDWNPQQLLSACGLEVWEFDHLVSGQPSFDHHVKSRVPSPVMDLAGGFDCFVTHLRRRKSKFRELTRTTNKLVREHGDVRFVFESHDIEALHTVMSWKSAQYLRTGWVDRFATRFMVELLERLQHTQSGTFSGVLSMLYAGDVPVAGHFGLRAGQTMSLWFPSYDIGFRSYGPGLIMNFHLAEIACAAGVRTVDMGPGPEEYKQWFRSRDLHVARGRVVRKSPRGGWHWLKAASTDRLHDVVLRNPALHRGAQRARAGYVRTDSALRRVASTCGPQTTAGRTVSRGGWR